MHKTTMEEKGLVISGTSPDGMLAEIVELPKKTHPHYIACQFHPEFLSKPNHAHPMFSGFVRAALEHQAKAAKLILFS